ncbi:hypothetical protein ACIBI9_21150 [Nonomuraea sp. NPDC050451]|uniref:hypothetical protein n=1 Tax=Nonomuraea sp. NPDC050451 TaxID=3364364 RepID=UPI0037B6B612
MAPGYSVEPPGAGYRWAWRGSPPDPLPPQGSWEIVHWCPEAADAAMSGMPVAVVWHFQLGPRP